MERKDVEAVEQDVEQFEEAQSRPESPRELPTDLPRSLDDRKNFRSYNEDVEYYDAWQGMSTR